MGTKILTSLYTFLNENKNINKNYDDFVSSLLPIDEFFEKLEIKVSQTSHISYSFSLSINGYKFASYVPCLKYDTEEYILENTILPRKNYWYEQYIEESFNDFINSNTIIENDVPLFDRIYVYKKKPLEPISFNFFNYNNLKNVKLFDSINISRYSILYRVK